MSDSLDDLMAFAAVQAVLANASQQPARAMEFANSVVDRLGVELALRHEAFRLSWTEAIDGALMAGDLAEATRLTDLVANLSPGLVPPYCRATVHRAKARIAAANGDVHSAAAAFRTAEEIFAELRYPYWLARTQLEHATWLAAQVRATDAAPYAEKAAATFDLLRADVWAARARELMTGPQADQDRKIGEVSASMTSLS
jgi:hypothetical protein